MAIPMTDLTIQYQHIKNEIDSAVNRVVESGQFILGPEVKQFEDEMSLYCGTKFAVGVASGTDALLLALLACGIKPGDEVITTPFTFFATSESIVRSGATPIFSDIDLSALNIDPEHIEMKINSHTRAIIPVHLYGNPCNMEAILDIAKRKNLYVIEDCAQSAGAEYNGKKVGSLGHVGCFSFFPAKNLGAYGDGGLVTTNYSEIADRLRILRVHGAKVTYYHTLHGINSRLDALQAAVLRVKLRYLNDWNSMRRDRAQLYSRLLGKLDGTKILKSDTQSVSSANYYTLMLMTSMIDRQRLRSHLESRGIQTAVYYPLSLHLQDVYQYMGYRYGDLPNSELAQKEVLSLPLYPELGKDQVEEIVWEISRFIEK